MWQLFIKGLEGKTYTVNITSSDPERTTVAQLKVIVEEKAGIEVTHQRLIYTSKTMEDKKILADYKPLSNHSNIFLVMRLKGGSEHRIGLQGGSERRIHLRGGSERRIGLQSVSERRIGLQGGSKCRIGGNECKSGLLGGRERKIDASLPRSNGTCMITMESTKENGIVVLKMPCGHPISPDGLMEYAWAEVSTNKKSEIRCPLCSIEWEFNAIKKYGGASAVELNQLELGISKNFCAQSSDINQCPKCESYCMRQDIHVNSVMCLICSRRAGFSWYFCWYCLQDWKNPLSSSTCGNANCNDAEKLARLHNCGKVSVTYINIEIFRLRACPECGTIIEFVSGCKHMTCNVCRVQFCFVCLRKKTQGGSWACGSLGTICAEAPRQTMIPRRQTFPLPHQAAAPTPLQAPLPHQAVVPTVLQRHLAAVPQPRYPIRQ